MRRFVVALAIGLVAEALMIVVYLHLAGNASLACLWTAFTLTQEPAWHPVEWVDGTRPGFEELMGSISYVPLVVGLRGSHLRGPADRNHRLWIANGTTAPNCPKLACVGKIPLPLLH
jgi:hypothetical protein